MKLLPDRLFSDEDIRGWERATEYLKYLLKGQDVADRAARERIEYGEKQYSENNKPNEKSGV